MFRRNLKGIVAALATVGITLSAQAVPVEIPQWGANTLDIGIGDNNNGSAARFNTTFVGYGFGPGFLVASDEVDDSTTLDTNSLGPWDRGLARSYVEIDPSTGNPAVHKNEAILTGNSSNIANQAAGYAETFSSELFQYTGATPTTLSLTFVLEGILKDPVTGDSSYENSNTQIGADVAVFVPDGFEYFEDLGTLIFEFGATLESSGGNDAVDSSTLLIDDDTNGLLEQRQTTLLFDVNPGDAFYVVQTMYVEAVGDDRVADGYNSLTSFFNNPNVVNVSPEPASLMLLGVGGLIIARRRG